MNKDGMEILVESNNIDAAIKKLNLHIANSRRQSLLKRRGLHPSRRGRLRAKRVANAKRLQREEFRKNGKKK